MSDSENITIDSYSTSATSNTITVVGVDGQADVLLKYAMPQCEYMYGCAATACGMLLAYYDLYGYNGYDVSNIIDGTVSVLSRGTDGNIYDMDAFDTTLGNFVATEDYKSRFYGQTSSKELQYSYVDGDVNKGLNTGVYNCLCDWLGTGQYWRGNSDFSTIQYCCPLSTISSSSQTETIGGISVPIKYTDGKWGLNEYLKTRGYSLNSYSTASTQTSNAGGTFTFAKFKAEIDAGRPVMVSLKSSAGGHMVVAYGYCEATQEVIFDDTYQTNCRIAWTGTYTYGGYSYSLRSMETIVFNTAGLSKLQDTPSVYTITVDPAQTGTYTLCSNSVSNAGLVKIETTDGDLIGFVSTDKTAYSATRKYALSKKASTGIYTLTITEDKSQGDATPPTITIATTQQAGTWTQSVTVSASFTDDVGVIQKQYKIGDSGTWKDYTEILKITKNCTVYFRASDAAGNESTSSIEIADIDTTAPSITTFVNTTDWTNGDVTISAVFSDNGGSNLKSGQYSLDGTTWQDYAVPLTITLNQTIHFKAVDNAGNETTKDIAVSNIDKSAPTIAAELSTMAWTNGDVTVSATFADEGDSGIKSKQYSLDGITWTDYAAPLTIATNQTIHFKAVDNAGNETTRDVVVSNIDKTLPTIVASVSTSTWTNGNVTVAAVFDDKGGSGMKSRQYSLDGGSTWLAYTDSLTIEENKTVKFKNIDNAGNEVTSDVVISNIDKTAPVIAASVSTEDWTNGDVIVTATFADEGGSGLAKRKYSLDGTTWKSCLGPLTISSNQTVRLLSVDGAGNETSEEIVVANIDKVAPTIVVELSTEDWTNGDVTVSVNFADEGDSCIKTRRYSLDGTTWIDYTEPLTIAVNQTVYFKATDNAGNETIRDIVISNIDKTAPVITAQMDPNGWTNGSVTVSAVFADDQESGIKSRQYSLDGTTWLGYSEPLTIETNQTIFFRATDNAGNESVEEFVVDNIDKIAPTIATSVSTKDWTSGNVIVSATFADDGGSEIKSSQYSLDGAIWTDYTDPVSVSENGTILFKATDNAGNTATQEVSVSNIDKTPPAISVSQDINDWTTESVLLTAYFDAGESENVGSPLIVTQYSLDGENWTDYTAPVKIVKNQFVYFRASDSVGNESSITHEVRVITNPEPVQKATLDGGTVTENITEVKTLQVLKGATVTMAGVQMQDGKSHMSIADNATVVMNEIAGASSSETSNRTTLTLKKNVSLVIRGDAQNVEKISAGNGSDVIIEGTLTGATVATTLSFGNNAVVKMGGADLNNGKNAITFGTLNTISIENAINGISKLNLGAGLAEKRDKYGQLVAERQCSSFESDEITGTTFSDSLSFGNYSETVIDGDINLIQGGSDIVKIGNYSTFSAQNVLFSDMTKSKGTFTIGTASLATIGTLENINRLSVSNGVAANAKKGIDVQYSSFESAEITGTTFSDSLSFGNYNDVNLTGDVDLSSGGSDTLKIGNYSNFNADDVKFSNDAKSKNTFSLGTASTATVNSITNANKVTLSNGVAANAKKSTPQLLTRLTAAFITGSTFGDTLSFGNDSKTEITGDVNTGDGNDTQKIGNNAVFNANTVNFGAGNDTLSIGKTSVVNLVGVNFGDGNAKSKDAMTIGSLSTVTVGTAIVGVNKITISNGTAANAKKGLDAAYTELTTGDITGTDNSDTLSFGNYVKVIIGDVDLGGGNDTLKLGSNSTVEIQGTLDFGDGAKDALTIGKDSTVSVAELDVESLDKLTMDKDSKLAIGDADDLAAAKEKWAKYSSQIVSKLS